MGKFAVLPPTMLIKTRQEAEKALAQLRIGKGGKRSRVVAIDTETTGLSRQRDYALIMSLSTGPNRYAIWPEAFAYFTEYIEDPELQLLMWNANFDTWMLRNAGIDIYRNCDRTTYRVFDAMIMHALDYDDRPHTLKYAAKELLGIVMVDFKATFGAQMRTRKLHEIFLDPANEPVVANYAGLDAYSTFALAVALQKKLLATNTGVEEYPTLWDYFRHTEVPFTRVLFECESNGIGLDKHRLIAIAPELDRKMIAIMRWFVKKTKKVGINLNSNPQMIELFFGDLGYNPPSYTEKGAPQLPQKWLSRIASDGCVYADKLLAYRDLKKKQATYVRGLLKLEHRGRIHTTYKQAGARTGRLSSAAPNLQNQPGYIRFAYIAGEEKVLIARDYSQLEMRILAHFSQEPNLIQAIRGGQDVHNSCAALMFKIPYDEIKAARDRDDEIDELKKAGLPYEPLSDREKECLTARKAAKTVNFGLLYGMGPQKLSRDLRIKVEVAKDYIRTYFQQMPGVQDHLRRVISAAEESGVVTTILGRRRQIPGIWSHLRGDIAQAERRAKNTPIQGTAADVTKMAMIKTYEDDWLYRMGYRMLLQVHDEIVGEAPISAARNPRFVGRLQHHMEHSLPYDLLVPLDTTGKDAADWAGCK